MRVKVVAISVVITILSISVIYAQNDNYSAVSDINSLKNKLAEHALSTNSIESSFTQEKHLWMLDEVLISKGTFLFKKENSVKWQYETPIKYTIIIHDGKFTIVNNGKVSEFSIDSNPMFHEINNMIVTAIRGDFMDSKDFRAEFFENNSNYLAKLVPLNKQVSSMLETIEIYFSKQNMQVVEVVFKEPGDDFTLIQFNNKKINSQIPDERFLLEEK